MKNVIVLTVFFLVFHSVSMAQVHEQVPRLSFHGEDASKYFSKKIRYPAQLFNCEHSRVLVGIRFNVNAQGRVSKLAFTGHIDDSTKNYLKGMVMKTDGHWKHSRVSKGEAGSKRIILPILFKMVGCKTNLSETLDEDIDQLLTFDSGAQDCILLNTLIVQGFHDRGCSMVPDSRMPVKEPLMILKK
jgi:hypothetical protein